VDSPTCHLQDEGPVPELTGICDTNEKSRPWFVDNFPSITVKTADYHELIASDRIDAVYCAVPHNLHERLYCDIINAGKHLLGEKPFGIDRAANGKPFTLVMETKRMAPGCTNTWFIEVYGTGGSVRFTTHDPKAFYTLETRGKEQGWLRIDIGSQSFIPSVTGGIFEFGFSDALQQMMAAFLQEFRDGGSKHPFVNVLPEETAMSHAVHTAALESHATGTKVAVNYGASRTLMG